MFRRWFNKLMDMLLPENPLVYQAGTVVEIPIQQKSLLLHRAYQLLRRFIIWMVILFLLLSISGIVIYRFIPPAITPLMLIRVKEKVFAGKKPMIKHRWVTMDKISPNLVLAVVASEDNRFTEHFGIDIQAIEQAQEDNRHRRRARGASTISQQTAKNLFLWPKHSYVRKGLEVYFTLGIEVLWSKERIMEVYLNMIEMGDGIYGAEAAARIYFHKSAARLTREEAALIAAVLPNPRRWKPNAPTPYINRRQAKILWGMRNIEKVEF
jgi:monofunctional glycosyltransferase